MSRRLEFLYDIQMQFEQPVRAHAFCLHCIPRSFPGQQIMDYSFRIEPTANWSMQTDNFGNLVQSGLAEMPHTTFQYTVVGTALVDIQGRKPEALYPAYRYSTALTAVSREMDTFVASLLLPEDQRERAAALVEAVHGRMEYVPGETGITTGAQESFASGRGVCQDYAHVFLALARHAGLAARYCNGLTVGDSFSHAWCEVYLDGTWIGVDPTRGKFTDDSYLVFNVGRDYNDCPIERGVFQGQTLQTQQITVKVFQQ